MTDRDEARAAVSVGPCGENAPTEGEIIDGFVDAALGKIQQGKLEIFVRKIGEEFLVIRAGMWLNKIDGL